MVRACSLLLAALPLCATWSVGVIDPNTRTIAVAAASCTDSVYGVAAVVPGTGFVFAQAASNMNAKQEAVRALRRGMHAAEIVRSIANAAFDRRWASQQYAVVTAAEPDKPASFTGGDTHEVRGVRAGKGISVQGNTLVNAEVLQATFDSLYRAKWNDDAELARAVLTAMMIGSQHGGDKRCGAATASSAFLTVVRAGDGETPYLNLVVRRSDAGSNNAVRVLQQRLNAAIQAGGE